MQIDLGLFCRGVLDQRIDIVYIWDANGRLEEQNGCTNVCTI